MQAQKQHETKVPTPTNQKPVVAVFVLTGVPGQLGLLIFSKSSCTEDMLALGEGATGVGG